MFQMETKRMERTEIVESSDIEYPKAKLYKRWFSGLIDIILTLFIGFLLYGITALVTNYVPSYKENSQTRLKLEIESGLYDSTGNLILNTLEDSKDSYDSKKACLSKAIDSFYSNSTFFDDDTAMNQYKGRKENAIDKDGNKLFVLDSNSNLKEGNLKAETYYDFYVYEISNYSIALLSSSDLFQTTSRVIVLTSVIEMFICFGIGYFISFNLIPMFLKRGRKTFGMYLFIGYILDIFTVFIPFLVSMAIMHLSKRGQDFFDYVSGTYIIDSKNREVYMSIEEYNQANKVKQMARIENKDYQPKSELH